MSLALAREMVDDALSVVREDSRKELLWGLLIELGGEGSFDDSNSEKVKKALIAHVRELEARAARAGGKRATRLIRRWRSKR